MQEVLSRTADGRTPPQGREFYELSLLNTRNHKGGPYSVRQTHAQWSEIDRQIMWDEVEIDHFGHPEEARKRYTERRSALTKMGFVCSEGDS